MKYSSNLPSNPNFPQLEEKILNFWNEQKIFDQSLNKNTKNSFVFYDGPPFANGLPHYGHLLTSCVKDTVGRFQTMCGNHVERKFGWDCHGLPAEMAAEKELEVSGRKAIEEFGIDKFNDHCKNDIMKYSGEWKKYIDRIGRWVDMENAYKTMDISFMESILWAFKNLYDNDLIYEEMRVMPYSWACQTPLSNFETRLDNSYRQKESKSLIVKFALKNIPQQLSKYQASQAHILVWTTTPWTLPSNLALAVNSELEYEYIFDENTKSIYISANLTNYCKDLGIKFEKDQKLDKISGKEIVEIEYTPLFDYFISNASENCFKIYHGDFVTATDGTGVVHIAPGFGEDDFELCKKERIGIKIFDENGINFHLAPAVPVNDSGCFTDEIYDFKNLQVFDANDEIIKKLKIQGNWIKTDQYLHQYPHCWRTDTPIIYRAMPSFYVKVTQSRDRLCELNQEINWIPENIKDGLFGNWLKEARDWSISRNRYFGTPIPIWKSTDPKHPCIKVFGSIKELEEFFGVKVNDLHRPFIDELTAPNPNDPSGKSILKRVPDVFDCWFESGSMSFAEYHYPFNNETHYGNFSDKNFDPKKYPPKRLPADFIVEYTAQTRGWFYTLMVLSTLIFDKIPFKNCICHGVILDEKGHKLSKRLQNYIDPIEAMNSYGADALRYVMLSSPVMNGGELLIDKDGKMLSEALRLVHKPIWSALNFFILYAKEDQPDVQLLSLNDIEKWNIEKNEHDFTIILRAFELNISIYNAMQHYKVADCYKAIRDFIDDLNNLYIRRNRDRFWGAEMNEVKSQAYNVLFSTLYYLAIAIAPLMPFLSEIIFQTILNNEKKSVHLENVLINEQIISQYQKLKIEKNDLLKNIQTLKDIFYSGRSLRDDKLKIRMRQPLQKCTIVTNLPLINEYSQFLKHEISDELNVKEVDIINEKNTSNETRFTRNLKLNIKILGKKYGQKLKEMQIALANKNYKFENDFIEIANEKLTKDEFYWEVKINEDFSNTTNIAINHENDYAIVILDEELSQDLILEGIMRDIVRSIQDARKKTLNISDRIELHIFSENDDIINACEKYRDYIEKETLVKDKKFFIKKIHNENELTQYEENLISQDMLIFGYEVENAMTKNNLSLKLSYKVI
jgi:isoleucyl-tRNA synthetase